MSLQHLADRLAATGLLAEPEVEETFVHGTAHFLAAEANLVVNVDPDVDPGAEASIDLDGLVARLAAFLEMKPARWFEVIEDVSDEITETPELLDGLTLLPLERLREDLEIQTIVVFPDEVLLEFASPKQFPGAVVRAQLNDDHDLEDLAVEHLES